MQRFGVIGNPIAHSLSPLIHNALFAHFSLQAHYQKILLPSLDALPSLLEELSGANITLPYKEDILPFCHEVRGIAHEIHAVNTLYCEGGKWIGYNTDAEGFYLALGGREIQNALILGAGGSAKAVFGILTQHHIQVSILNRSVEKLSAFRGMHPYVRGEHYDVVINATSAGLHGELPMREKDLKEILLHSDFAFDLIYPSAQRVKTLEDFLCFLRKREETIFSSFAKECKIPAIDGLDMLCYQAFLAFEIFCQKRYGFEEIKEVFYPKTKR